MAAKDDFTLDDFRKQFNQLEKMGPMKDLLANMPGLNEMIPEDEEPEAAFQRIRGMIDAMTDEERQNPDGIDFSHCQRIAAESGTDPKEVEQFLEQFKQVRRLMRKISEMSVWQRIKMVCGLGRGSWDDKE